MLAPISCYLLQLGLLFIALLFGVLLFASFVAAGPQKWPQNNTQSPQNRPQRPPKASQNWPKMTPEAPWGPPGGPKSSLFWRGSIFEAILDPKMEPKWTPKSTKSLPFLWKSGLSSLFGHMFPALQMFSHLLVKFASIFGRPNPWKPLFFLGKTTIFKKPLFFKRWPKRTQNDLKICRKLPQNAPENTKKANKCRFWGGPKTYWKKRPKKAPK